jgi:DNA helicase-2/ATP-dependent DNA helicase PcrA
MLVMSSNIFVPSPHQTSYFDWIVNGNGSCVLQAVAGAGKTTTLVYGLKLMVQVIKTAYPKIFFGAFNKDIVREIRTKVTDLGRAVTVNTFHAEGLGAMRRPFPNIKVENRKCVDIFRAASARTPAYEPLEGPVLQLVSYAKQAGIGLIKRLDDWNAWMELVEHFDVETFSEETGVDNTKLVVQLARKVLERSNEICHEVVDFNDMIYAPLFKKVKFFKYDWVLVDEAQDTNATRRLLALAILKPGGRLVAVGDKHQAIYGFTGADSNALDLISQATNAKQLPLTTTYRCPKAIVAYAQQWVSHIQCADSAPEGLVEHAQVDQLSKIAHPGDAVLCRFNAPLVKYVYAFIADGIPALVQGSDIASGLHALARRWKKISTYTRLSEKLEEYRERETTKFRAKEQEAKAAAIEDKVACLVTIINRAMKIDANPANVVERVCIEIDTIFAKDDNGNHKDVVLFSSIHKAKGREWNNVVWLQCGPSPGLVKLGKSSKKTT